MRIYELTGYKSNPIYDAFRQSKDLDEFSYRLKNTGYQVRELGHGSFAIVFQRPGRNEVYKLFTTSDHGYMKFFQFALKNQDNPHLPRVYGKPITLTMDNERAKKTRSGNRYYLIRTEKLEKAKDPTPNSHDMRDFIEKYNNLKETEELIKRNADSKKDSKWQRLVKRVKGEKDVNQQPEEVNDQYKENIKEVKEFTKKWPKLAELLIWIGQNENRASRLYIDLEPRNIMQRHDGTVVITDPYSYFGPAAGPSNAS